MKKNLKKLISTVAALAISASSFSAFAANFTDVADTADYKVAVDNLVALDIVGGYSDGTFKPENDITRAEVSKMIVGTMGPAMMAAAESSMGIEKFSDVGAGHWASGYVAQGVSNGFINGMGDGTFAPEANVTYEQVVKMLVCVLGYADDAEGLGGYPNGYITKAADLEITDGVGGTLYQNVNRGQVAMLINNSLDVPVNAITGYEQGFILVDDKLVPTQVPVTEVYDGNGDSGKYETLLTTYFDAYSVRGRITDTTGKGKGTVAYTVEYAENFDGEVGVYTGKKDAETYPIAEAIYPAGMDVDSLLCAYTDAIIMENEDGDWEIVSIASYGKNEIVTLSSELYDDHTSKALTFYKSATSSKTDEYDLNDNTAFYVNGVLIEDEDIPEVDEEPKYDSVIDYVLGDFVDEKATTEVKLVNTPAAGSKSIDSTYDFVMLSVYTSATVDEVMIDEEEANIYLDVFDSTMTGGKATITINLEDVAAEEASYTLVDEAGNVVALEALAYNDVITIYTDVTAAEPLNAPASIDMVVTKNVVSGKVSGENTDDGTYTINGAEYGFAYDAEELNVGDEYTLYLDKFGKIVKYEKTASVVNYGIINKVWTNTNTGEESIRLVNANGEIVTYEFNKSTEYDTWNTYFNLGIEDDEETEEDESRAAYNTLDFEEALNYIIVTYEVNSSDKIHSITSVIDEKDINDFKVAEGEYSEKNSKVGSAKMSDLTKVIDFAEAKDNWADVSLSGKVGASSVASFADGTDYKVVYGGAKFTDGTYPVVIVLEGADEISTTASFVVAQSVGSSLNNADGITYTSVEVLDGKATKTLYFADADTAEAVTRGDAFVYGVDGDGLVDEVHVIFEAEDSIALEDIADLAAYVDYDKSDVKDYKHSLYYTKSGVASWDNLDETDEYARVGFGVIIDKSSTELTVGKVEKVGDKYQTSEYEEIDLASDVNVYVYEQGKRASERLSVGAVANLLATRIAKTYYAEDAEGNDLEENVYRWTDAGETAVNTVFFKTVEDEITDIIVVIPA